MSDERKRIYELDSAETIASNDSLVIDNPNREEAVKIPVNSFKTLLTQTQYDALPSSKNTDGIIYYITDNNKIMLNGNSYGGVDVNAEVVSYDNTTSELEADNVQDAIDEVLETAGKVDDVKVDGESVVDENKVANIDLSALKIVRDIPNTPTAIATFTDGANLPMPKLEVGIEPVQDLHGYDAPWVGGAGKNILPLTVDNIKTLNGGANSWTNNTKVINGITYTILTDGNGNVTGINMNGTANSTSMLFLYNSNNIYNGMKVNGCPNGSDYNAYNLCFALMQSPWTTLGIVDSAPERTITIANDVPVACYLNVENGKSVSNKVAYPMIRLATVSDATFAPYSNICPIIGWDECNVGVSGVNVWDEEWENGYYFSNSSGKITKASSTITIRSKNPIPIKPNTSYHIVGTIYRFFFVDNDNNVISSGNNVNFTTPSNARFLYFYCENITTYNNDISINYPSTDTEYHAYNGQTYTIDLDGTRYGGKLDVVSGVMTVDRVEVDLGTLNWSKYGDDKFYTSISDIKMPETSADRNKGMVCSNYKPSSTLSVGDMEDGAYLKFNQAESFWIRDSRYTDATAFKTAMSGVQLVYELATPLTIQLPTTVVKSLRGVNNVSADCGDVRDGKYIADASSTIASLDARITALENQ